MIYFVSKRFCVRIFDIKKQNRYETVTLFNEDTPITLSVQEYKESL